MGSNHSEQVARRETKEDASGYLFPLPGGKKTIRKDFVDVSICIRESCLGIVVNVEKQDNAMQQPDYRWLFLLILPLIVKDLGVRGG